MPGETPRQPRAPQAEAPEARPEDDLRDLLRQTRRHLRAEGPVHPRRAPIPGTPRRRPRQPRPEEPQPEEARPLQEVIAPVEARPAAPQEPLVDPGYVAWSAAVVGTLFATGLVVGLVTLWFLPVRPRATGMEYAWPWALVSVGSLAAGLSIATTAWPKRSDQMPTWTMAVAGGLSAMLLSIGLFAILWFLRVLTAG